MIFVWLGRFFAWLHWLIIPPLTPPVREIDIDAPCPMCGHRKGKLSAGENGGKPACVHTCLVCGARSFEDPILAPVKVTGAPSMIAVPAEPVVTKPEQKKR
jgi:hypothetical protein